MQFEGKRATTDDARAPGKAGAEISGGAEVGVAAGAEKPALPPRRRVGTPVMLAYGFGTIAYGVKDFAFSTFLLLFYNQVLGLPAASVGFAIMCALLLDAFIDPAIGFLSDRTDTKWGRRHPWMYASALPIAIGWLLLWNPPAMSDGATLFWVFAMSVIVRSAVSAYEVPSQALSAELTVDYDARTRLMAYRYLFGWGGGLGMLVLTYAVFLAPHGSPDSGVLNRDGYVGFSITGAAVIAIAILVSALGTHREIARLPRVKVVRRPLSGYFAELLETVRNRAFLVLILAGVCFYTAQGISFAMSNYLYVHVWQFGGLAFSLLGGILLVGAGISFVIAPITGRRLGKPVAAMAFMVAAAVLLTGPYWLRLAGLFPQPGDPAMLPTLFLIFMLNAACGISSTILGASMMADVVEESEVKTGRRSEGVFFAGSFFVQKCTSGLGIFIVGAIVSGVGFPTGAAAGSVPLPVIDRLTLAFAGLYMGLGFAAAFFYRRFPFGRAEHDARIAAMAKE